jgi:Amidohydrolase
MIIQNLLLFCSFIMRYLTQSLLLVYGLSLFGCGRIHSSPSDQPLPTPHLATQSPFPLADAHLHLVDFLQRTEGIRSVIAAMDRTGVTDTMISGMPLVKKWDSSDARQPQYYLEDDSKVYWYSATDVLVARAIESLKPEERSRFHPFISGFNGSDMNAVDHIKRMLEWYPGIWEGIGEVMARHDDLTSLTYGEVTRASTKSLDAVYELAAERDLPVSIHSNISSVWVRDPLYLPEIERALHNHPKTRFIWCHAGISRRIEVPTLTSDLTRLFKKYNNLWVDISWVVYESAIAPHGTPAPEWIALFEKYPTRFMIGSDKVGTFGNYEKEILKYIPLLKALKPTTAAKVGRENFLSILPKKMGQSKDKA